MKNQDRIYRPFIGPFDPCLPMREKRYVVPPNLFIVYQPMNLPQFNQREALKRGTLWPVFYSHYEGQS